MLLLVTYKNIYWKIRIESKKKIEKNNCLIWITQILLFKIPSFNNLKNVSGWINAA